MRKLPRALALATIISLAAAPLAAADDSPDAFTLDARWRKELAISGCFGGLRLLKQDLGPGGLCLMAGIRNHDLALMADYRVLSVTWPGTDGADALAAGLPRGVGVTDPADGVLQRFGVAARYNLITLGSSGHGDNGFFHEFFELFAEGGVGVERIGWDGGGEYTRSDFELGGGVRLYGIRFSDKRTVGLLFRIADFLARRPGADGEPTCVAPCTGETPPNVWDRGIIVSIGLVIST
jgi:hypothetical protein